jgi:cytochrome P450
MLARRLGAPDPLERLRRQRAEIDELLLAEIGERRASGGGEDILSLLLDARFEDGEAMADQEICDQLVTLLVAGHETTATALAWTLELLVHHPDALARLGDGSDAAYLKAVISESLRLRPVVPLAGRRLSQPLQVDGVELPEGTDVTPAIWLAHTRADVYPEPFAFRPERWLDGSPPPGYAWVPFGGGVRRCLGAAFAEMEMRVALATMLSLVRVQAATADPERVARRNVTFSPAKGTRLVAWET